MNSDFVEETKKKFESTINDLEKYDTDRNTKKKVKFNEKVTKNTIKEEIESDEDIEHKSRDKKSEINNLSKVDKMKVKQRMISFSMKYFEKFDLKKILNFWIGIYIYNIR